MEKVALTVVGLPPVPPLFQSNRPTRRIFGNLKSLHAQISGHRKRSEYYVLPLEGPAVELEKVPSDCQNTCAELMK